MATWQGRPSPIDSRPGYRWPLIDRVAVASRQNAPREEPAAFAPLPPLAPHPALPGSAALIRQRRSAQRFDPKQQLAKAAFYRILDALLPRPQAPWNSPSGACRIHLLLFVMRVAGLPSGLYLLPRTPTAGGELSSALRLAATGDSELLPVADIDPDCPPHLGLLRLRCMELQELQRHARALSCHQDIASTSAFSLGMLGEFERATAEAQGYRTLLREAGRVGQALYLEAEAAGVRGTGIGCFFDDPVHQLVGLAGTRYQSIYHFTVGTPVSDPRIASEPAYPRHQEKPS